MPLKRTPPSSSTSQANQLEPTEQIISPLPIQGTSSQNILTVEQSLQHCSSEPNLAKKINAPIRIKRKFHEYEQDDSMLYDFMTKFEKMFEDFQSKQNQKMDKLCETVESIREAVDMVEGKLDTLTERVTTLESNRDLDAQYIQILEDKLELAARNTRATCLEIRNIPSPPKETKTLLLDTFIKICSTVDVQVKSHEVKDIFRIKSKDTANRIIIVDLTSCLLKEKIIFAYRKFNKGTSKLSTQHLRIDGPIKIRECFDVISHITSKQKRLFFLARDFANTNNYKYCWVSSGKIFLRQLDNGPLVKIASETDLAKLKKDKK